MSYFSSIGNFWQDVLHFVSLGWEHTDSTISAIASALAAWLGFKNRNKIIDVKIIQEKQGQLLDGKMEKLLLESKAASHAAGRREGVDAHDNEIREAVANKASADSKLDALQHAEAKRVDVILEAKDARLQVVMKEMTEEEKRSDHE